MLNRFSELVAKGVAPSPYQTDTFSETSTGTCALCRLYNNIWGSVSGTCMANKGDGKFVITGSMFRQPDLWEKFLTSENWGLYVFKQASKFATLRDLFDAYGLEYVLGTQNNDPVLELRKKVS